MTVCAYIPRRRDGRYYVGSTRGSLERRVAEHNAGAFGGYTSSRRPVELVFHQSFANATDAIAAERQLKGWSWAKKEALIRDDYEALRALTRNRTDHPAEGPPHPSTSSG